MERAYSIVLASGMYNMRVKARRKEKEKEKRFRFSQPYPYPYPAILYRTELSLLSGLFLVSFLF